MSVKPEGLFLHLARVDAVNGTWLITVASLSETQSGKNLLAKLVLEQNLGEETFRSRELSLIAPASLLFEPENNVQVIDQIRDWVEKTEGDGFLDLTRTYSR